MTCSHSSCCLHSSSFRVALTLTLSRRTGRGDQIPPPEFPPSSPQLREGVRTMISATRDIASKVASKLRNAATRAADQVVGRAIPASASHTVCGLESLEERRLFSTIVWDNRGLASDGFAGVFGA